MDLMFAEIDQGRVFPVEWVHLERYIGTITKKNQNSSFHMHNRNTPTTSQKKRAWDRTLKFIYDTMEGPRGAHLKEETKKKVKTFQDSRIFFLRS